MFGCGRLDGLCHGVGHVWRAREFCTARVKPDVHLQHVKGWEGGVSIDYAVVGHVHISWHPGGTEQGSRFAHDGSGLMGALHRLWAGILKIFD
jgi:hypothetical protein